MIGKSFHKSSKLNRRVSILLAVVLVFSCIGARAAVTSETPEAAYVGVDDATVMLNNIRYLDVQVPGLWSAEAIYETGALNLMKGYGARNFGRTNPVTKEQAIAMAYRLAGREADAQKAAEALDLARAQEQKKTNPVSMWSDGYLQLAKNEGILTAQQLKDAFETDPTVLTPDSFYRSAPAQRQEVADWMAKILKLPPVYGQQKIFNNYNDWQNADPLKIPYIEAILQNNIMNGDGRGNFNPRGTITREQMAQVAKNAEGIILPLLKYEKKTGTIEKISDAVDASGDSVYLNRLFNVRNSNGRLHQIGVHLPEQFSDEYKNEQGGGSLPAADKDLIVYKNGGIGKSDLLEKGDRIEYITAPDNTVRFVKVLSSGDNTSYFAATVNSVDPSRLLLNVSPLFKMDSPDIGLEDHNISFNVVDNATFNYSNSVAVLVDGKTADITKVTPGMEVVLAVRNGMVVGVNSIDLHVGDKEEKGVVQGIVEDNNPQLGYITLYSEEGMGTSPEVQKLLVQYRTYNYGDQNNIEVYKNHKKAGIGDIGTGDTVFLKLDDKNNVTGASAVDNYTVKYGKVIAKRPSNLVVEYDDGTIQSLDVDNSIPVIAGGKLSGYNALKDGDGVKLLLDETNKGTNIKEITVEGDEHFITNIYKGIVSRIDDTSNNLLTQNLEILDRGQWVRGDRKGFTGLRLSDGYNIYANGSLVDVDMVNSRLKNNEAYIAVEKDYGGAERAVAVSFRNEDDTEPPPYDDIITNVIPGGDTFGLSKEYKDVKYNPGTIVVKDGRLVSGSSMSEGDTAYVVANRSFDSGDYYAGVVQISQRPDFTFAKIYRGRISNINQNKDFTLESFSQLDGSTWNYFNTPKTFKLTYNTTILGDSGVVNQRDFIGYGDKSYKNSTVYVLDDGAGAVLVSTAPYGVYNAKGEIFDVTGGSLDEDGKVLQQPNGLKLWGARVYDTQAHTWTDSKDMTLTLLKNSIIIKDNKVAQPSDLKKGDQVRVIKKDNTEKGDGFIVIVEP